MNPALSKPPVVFVVAHPDDVAFSMGGTAWLLKDRYQLHVICASQGERGYASTVAGPKPPCPVTAATRAREEAAACALLDARLSFLGLIDGELFAERSVCERIAGMLAAIKPVALFALGPLEKPDHAAMSLAARLALHLADLYWTTELLMPFRHGETVNMSHASLFVNISSVIEHKRQLIRCHTTQAPDESAVERVLVRNMLLGKMAWCEYAEAYITGLPLVATRWQRPAGSILMQLASAAASSGGQQS